MKSSYSKSVPAAPSAVPSLRRISRARHGKLFARLIAGCSLLAPLANKAQTIGATTPFITHEAEAGTLAGGAFVRSMGPTLPTAPTPELEASGQAFVELNTTNASVAWTTTATANTIVVRECIPDSPTGGGITATLDLYVNGTFRQALTFTSKYTWVYGVDNFTDENPADGTPKRFYESTRAFITGAAVPSGSTIMLKKDSTNTASFYYIDLIHLENVGAALSQPANTLSITAYGATPNDTTDDTTAIQNCANACQAQGKGMWIPPGVFINSQRINLSGVNVYGAGMWYSTIQRTPGSNHAWVMTNGSIQDIYIDNLETGRSTAQGHDYGILIDGANGWTVQRVWANRCGACFWGSGTDGTVKDCRAIESWADGINLNNGPTVDPNKAGLRLTAQNNYIIGPGDDGIAVNAQNGSGTAHNVVDAKVLNNTSIGSYWGNGLRINGGRNTTEQYNLVTDANDCNGIRVGMYGVTGNPCESALVANNTVLRCGGLRTLYGNGGIDVTDTATATINSNTVSYAHTNGIQVNSCTASFTGNSIDHPAQTGILIQSGASGSGTFTSNSVSGLNSGQVAFQNDSSSFTTTLNNNSWQGSPAAAPTFSPSGGTYTSAQNVTITTTTSGASIRYTTDGSTPSSTAGTIYSGPVNISTTTTLKAIAYKSGMIDSTVTSATYTINSGAPVLLSQGQPVTASSFQTGNDPSLGNDGSLTTRWGASGPGYPQWWRVDLGANHNLSQVVINWYDASTRSYQYRIEVSTDDVNYTTVIDQTGRTATGDTTDNFTATDRYVRITMTGVAPTGGYASFYECQVYGN